MHVGRIAIAIVIMSVFPSVCHIRTILLVRCIEIFCGLHNKSDVSIDSFRGKISQSRVQGFTPNERVK